MTRTQQQIDDEGTRGSWPWRYRWTVETIDPAVLQTADVVAALEEFRRREAAAAELDPADLAPAVVSVEEALSIFGRSLVAAGAGPAPGRGSVVQVAVSNGGVPKTAVDTLAVGVDGIAGDAQNDRKHHGKPIQAVCLYSADVIDALRAEGHPIVAGAAGENITVQGIDWAALRPGVRLEVGATLLETTAWAIPCAKNAAWFSDRDHNRMHHDTNPGWSRIYASVLRGGSIGAGDAVVVEP